MSVLFIVKSKERISMIADSQATNIETGEITHDAQKIWKPAKEILIGMVGREDVGRHIINATIDAVAEIKRTSQVTAQDWVEYIREASIYYCSDPKMWSSNDFSTIIICAGKSCKNGQDAYAIFLSPSGVREGALTERPVNVMPPVDVPIQRYNQIENTAIQSYGREKDDLTFEDWENLSLHILHQISCESVLVDDISQRETILLRNS